MIKLIKISLVSAVLATSAMADTNYLPGVIEAGSTVYVNTDISAYTVENYGTIDTEVTSAPYPKVSWATINNHVGQTLGESTDTSLLSANPVDGVIKVYEIKGYAGSIDSNIDVSDSNINTVDDTSALDFKSLTSADLVSLSTTETGKSITITGPDGSTYDTISCHFGDQGSSSPNSYNMKLSGWLTFDSDLSNYKNGSIDVTNDAENIYVSFKAKELHVPMVVSADSAVFSNMDIYSTVNVKNGALLKMWSNVTLKSGAVLRIGEIN